MKKALLAAAALVAVVVLVVAIVHTAPVRRYVLRRAVATIEERLRIRLQAGELSYNVFALRVTLRQIRAAADTKADAPFFSADEVTVVLPRSALFGPFSIESVVMNGGRITIVREADGRTNLPETGGERGEPQPLNVDSVLVRRLSVDAIDRASRSRIQLPAVDLTISPKSGRLDLREPGRLTRGEAATVVREMHGGVAFDGRHVRLSNLALRTSELTAAVDGNIGILVDEPGMDLKVRGRADAEGVARWADLEAPPRGDVDLTGTVAGPFAAPMATLSVTSPKFQWQSFVVDEVRADARVSADALHVNRLATRVAGGTLEASASMVFDGDTHIDGSWSGVDIETLMRMADVSIDPRPNGRVSGRLQASGPGVDLDRWGIKGHIVTSGGTTGARRVAIGGRADLSVDRGRWTLDATEAVGGIPLRAALSGRLDAASLQRSSVSGEINVPSVDVARVVDLLARTGLASVDTRGVDGSFEANATVTGTIGRPQIAVKGSGMVADVGVLAPDTPLQGPADVTFESDLRTARIEAALRDLAVSANADIALAAPHQSTVDVSAQHFPLERALEGRELPVPIAGTVSATAHATGALDRWENGQATIDVQSLDATMGKLPVRLIAPARATVAAKVVNVESLQLSAGDTRITAAGSLPLVDEAASSTSPRALDVTATGDLAQFLNAVAATGMVTMPDVSGSGPAALLARVTGTAQQPRVEGDVELGPGTVRSGELPPATNVSVRVHSDGAWIDLRTLQAEWQGSQVNAEGRAPLAWFQPSIPAPQDANGTVTMRLTSVTPRVAEPFVEGDTLADIEGSVDATLQLRSPSLELNDVTGEIRLDRMELQIANLPVAQREPTRIAIRNGFAEVESWQWAGQGGTAGVHGRVRLSDRQAALLADGRFDLRMLTPFTRDAGIAVAGTFEPRLSITGVLDDTPRIDGVATITDAVVRLADPRVIATDVDGRIVLSRRRAQVTSLSGTVNGGTLSGTGTLDYAPGEPIDGSLNVKVDGMAMEFPEGLHSELDLDITTAINVPPIAILEPAGRVSGTLLIERSVYREPIAFATGLLTALRTRRVAAGAVASEPSLVDNLLLDVRVITNAEDITVDNNIGRLSLGTDLRVIGTVAAPALSGRAQLAEGGQLFLGRNRYQISSGTIDFANPTVIEPELNVVATTRAGGEDIEITIAGTAEQPEIEARSISDSDLGQADVMSLLLTGRKLDEISGNEAEIVGEQALAFLSGDVLGFASRAVGLDTIRLGGVDEATSGDTSAIATTDVDPNARLTFSKSIGRSIDVAFSQALRDGDAQTWIVDYRPHRQLEVRFVTDDENLRSYEFRHDVSFGGASLSSSSTPARERRPPPRVTTVTVAGLQTLPEARVRGELKLEAGDEFDFAEWQSDRDRIEDLVRGDGFYEARVDARRQEGDAGVALTYTIAEGPRGAIEVSGYTLDEATIDALRRAWFDAVVDDFLVDEAKSIVERRLTADGFLYATVETSIATEADSSTALGTSRKTLRVRIEPGSKTATRTIRFEGVQGDLEAALREWAVASSAGNLATDNPAEFERTLTAWLRARGHLAAKVVVGAPVTTGTEAVVPVTVEAGPAYIISNVHVQGAAALKPEDVTDAIQVPTGAPYDPVVVDEARDRLQARYRRRGFTAAEVTTRPAIDRNAQTAAVTFVVDEGPRQVLKEVTVTGNRGIDTDVIVRALDLKVGQPVGVDDWLQARRRVFNTGLFRRVDVTPEPIEEAPKEAREVPVRARVVVQEWPAVRLRYGFQVAEERPEDDLEGRDLVPGFAADVSRRTLFGRAVTLGGAVDLQRREQSGRAFARSRTMFRLPIESSLVLERSREEIAAASLVTSGTEVSWEQRVRAWRHVQLSYAYSFERNHTVDTGIPDPNVGPLDLIVKIATLNGSVAWDTRDNVADAARGWLLSSSFDWAPAGLGSDFRFVKHLAQAYYFRPWRGVVLASAARLGMAAPLGGQALVPSERYFSGGARSVRAVDEDTLGPRGALGDPTGGESVLVLNQEVRFPIYRWLRGVGFIDAGNVFADTTDVRFGDLVTAYGAGLRLATPFAMFRIDYGRLFSPQPGLRSDRLTFGIGQAF